MKICFFDPSPPPDSSRHDAMLLALSERHALTLIRPVPGLLTGVQQLTPQALPADFWRTQAFDLLVWIDSGQTEPPAGLPARLPLVRWLERLPADLRSLTARLASGRPTTLVCQTGYQRRLLLAQPEAPAAEQVVVAPAALAPLFAPGFAEPDDVLQAKPLPLTLACVGFAGPGLELLLRLLPDLQRRQALRVCWLPPPAHQPEDQDAHRRLLALMASGARFQVCQDTPAARAEVLRRSHVLLYPVAGEPMPLALQALASGCRVVAPAVGALPELTRGWARLMPVADDEPTGSYWLRLIQEVQAALDDWHLPEIARLQLAQALAVQAETGPALAAGWWDELLRQHAGRLSARPAQLPSWRWGLVDFSLAGYHAASPAEQPLTPAQEQLCLLARGLAARGQRVTLLNPEAPAGIQAGVHSMKLGLVSAGFWERQFDLLVGVDHAERLQDLPGRKLLWQARPQPGTLARVHFSAWQQAVFGQPGDALILPGLDAGFAFSTGEREECLVFASEPDRGLMLLLEVFAGLRRQRPGLRLKLHSPPVSSLQAEAFARLYAQAAAVDGVDLLGSLNSGQRAALYARSRVLVYPGVCETGFAPEIAEALASGCRVVAADLGALPELAQGCARLVPFTPDLDAYGARFGAALAEALDQPRGEAEALSSERIQAIYAWPQQLRKWEALARRLLS